MNTSPWKGIASQGEAYTAGLSIYFDPFVFVVTGSATVTAGRWTKTLGRRLGKTTFGTLPCCGLFDDLRPSVHVVIGFAAVTAGREKPHGG